MDAILTLDIGSGRGCKAAMLTPALEILAEDLLPIERYGDKVGVFVERLAEVASSLAKKAPAATPRVVGLASPGIFSADGTALVVANLAFLQGERLGGLLSSRLGLPVYLQNDAKAGAHAEWLLSRRELVYWTLGGGWGGTWVGNDGQPVPEAVPADPGKPTCLTEPGFTLPLSRQEVEREASRFDLAWECLESILPAATQISDPEYGECFRAESLTGGGLGLSRLYQAFQGGKAPAVSAQEVGSRGAAGETAALQAEKLFSSLWGLAAGRFFHLAAKLGLTQTVPVFLAGGMTNLSKHYLPGLAHYLLAANLRPDFHLSLYPSAGRNANLIGAASLAWQCFTQSGVGDAS